jgi:hypothetical protein
VTGVYESPFFSEKGEQLSWKKVYLDGDLRDAASDNPTFSVSYIESPEQTSYTALATFSESTTQKTWRTALRASRTKGWRSR